MPECYSIFQVGKRRRHFDINYDTDFMATPDLPHFSSTPYQYSSYNYTSHPPLKPCLKRPVNQSIADQVFHNRKMSSTPSAFQPFSTISEGLEWNPYGHLEDDYSSYSLPKSFSYSNLSKRPTNFRSEISRFTESLYNLAKPTPIKPRGQFPRVERNLWMFGSVLSSF